MHWGRVSASEIKCQPWMIGSLLTWVNASIYSVTVDNDEQFMHLKRVRQNVLNFQINDSYLPRRTWTARWAPTFRRRRCPPWSPCGLRPAPASSASTCSPTMHCCCDVLVHLRVSVSVWCSWTWQRDRFRLMLLCRFIHRSGTADLGLAIQVASFFQSGDYLRMDESWSHSQEVTAPRYSTLSQTSVETALSWVTGITAC